ncbi:MAG: lytic transglycosylase domain-containing protein [Pseudomonadota bacterium]
MKAAWTTCLAAAGVVVLAATAAQASAAQGPDALTSAEADRLSSICDAVARRAAEAEGVPEDLMRAISLAETGRGLDGRHRPWPWTVNMEGEGRWFADPDALLAWVNRRRAEGARSFDLGCFQVNHLWHGEAFESLEAMLDPLPNALYAARFLKTLHAESGSWETAAGHYHSRTPALADRYRRRVLQIRAALGPAPQGDVPGVDVALAPPADPGRRPPRRAAGGERPPLDYSRRVTPDGAGGLSLMLAGLAAAQGRLIGPPRSTLIAPSDAAAGGLLRRARPLVEAPKR